MSTNEINRQLKLIDASRKIATIYTHYGQVHAALAELSALGRMLQADSVVNRRAM